MNRVKENHIEVPKTRLAEGVSPEEFIIALSDFDAAILKSKTPREPMQYEPNIGPLLEDFSYWRKNRRAVKATGKILNEMVEFPERAGRKKGKKSS